MSKIIGAKLIAKNVKLIAYILIYLWLLFISKETIANSLEGPVVADVLRVIDGDTIVVRARIWLNQNLETAVRIKGIDVPEIHGKCEEETILAFKAKKFVESKIGDKVFLYNISTDKYGGRVVAKVVYFDKSSGENRDLKQELLKNNLGIPYNGETKKSWCLMLTMNSK